MKKYKNEIIIVFIGLVLSVIEGRINAEYTFLIIAITLLIDLALISIKGDIEQYIDSVDECQRLIGKIGDKRWRNDATEMYKETKRLLEKMSSGNREISAADISNQEMALMKKAKSHIHCIYYADSVLKLEMRLSSRVTNPLSTILTGYRELPYEKVEKTRVIVLSNIDFNIESNRKLLREVDAFNTKLCKEGGLGFEMRYVLLTKLMEHQISFGSNLLLVDDKEATTVRDKTVYPEDYLTRETQIVRDLICRGIIDPAGVNSLQKVYKKIWELAVPVERFLDGYQDQDSIPEEEKT